MNSIRGDYSSKGEKALEDNGVIFTYKNAPGSYALDKGGGSKHKLQLDNLHLMMHKVLTHLPQLSMMVMTSIHRSTENSAPKQTQD